VQKLHVHMHKSAPHSMVEDLLIDLYPSVTFFVNNGVYTYFSIDINDTVDLPLEDLYNLLVTDFEMRFTLCYHPSAAKNLIGNAFSTTLNVLPSGTFSFEETLFKLYKAHPENLSTIKTNLNSVLTQTDNVTLTAFGNANMKALRAAKRLFIHRNTMQYRLDHIQEMTGIDVKTFKGLFIIHALQSL